MNQNDNLYEKEYLDEEISDDEFVESFSAKERRRQKQNNLDLTYLEEEVKNVYIYPLTTLTGKNSLNGIRISPEKTTIMCTTPDKGKKIRIYLEEIEGYDLNQFLDPANPTEQLIKNSNQFNCITEDIDQVDNGVIYLLTFDKLNEKNFNDTKKYFGKTLTSNIEDNLVQMTFAPIEEFSNLFKAEPIKVVLSEPMTEKIKQINIKTPVGTLIGNIKAIDENGHQPSLLATNGTEVFPKLVFPFQTQPKLATVEYWASKQIIPFQEIFSFLDSKGIEYDQEFSLQDFLKLGNDVEDSAIHFDNVKSIEFLEEGKRQSGYVYFSSDPQTGASWNFQKDKKPQSYSFTRKFEIEKSYNQNDYSGLKDKTNWTSTPDKLTNINIIKINAGKNTSAFKAILQMMTESFWKDMEFKGATKIDWKDNQYIEMVDDKNIFQLQQKYSGQDRYTVTTNAWIAWKRKNPDLVNANLDMIKRIENTIAMLSGSIKCNYSINKGDNDDYKILLPYYFEHQNKLDNPSNFAEYLDLKVKLKSEYGNFTRNGFIFINKNISQSNIFELDYNHFAFPELTKNVETASIPSSMPLDQQLANGEYSKYKMLNFAKDENLKQLYLNRYGSGNMEFDPISSHLHNEGEFILQNETNIEELMVSAFYGYGDWMIEFLTTSNKKYKLNTNLFSKFENTKTLLNLIL